VFRSFEFAVNERLVNHNLGCDVAEFTPLPRLELPSPRLEVALHSVDPTEMQSMSENDLECFARTGVNTPAMAKMTDDGPPGSYPKADTGSIGGFRPARREVVPKSASGKSAPIIAVDKETGSNSQWILAFENQVFIDEFFWPVQPLGISHLQTPVGRRFLNAVSRVSGSA
jgi:hypothetical protein